MAQEKLEYVYEDVPFTVTLLHLVAGKWMNGLTIDGHHVPMKKVPFGSKEAAIDAAVARAREVIDKAKAAEDDEGSN